MWNDALSTSLPKCLLQAPFERYRKKYKHLDIRAIKIWARQILSGLVYLHEHDPPVIHRDLKCDNIFVNGHLGQVKIGDLGLAAILHNSRTAHSVIGTPEFMAPELYDENYNELVDVYSFGMCLLELFTCEYPYSECTNPAQIYKKVTSGKLPRAFYKIENVEVLQFIRKCLEPASKRKSAKELLRDPFIAFQEAELLPLTKIGYQKPILNEEIGFEKLQLAESKPRTDMTITGKLNAEDDSIFLKVQITEEKGSTGHVYFPFDILHDTALDVGIEMVKELEISDWEPHEIANMIDETISGLLPHWKRVEQAQLPDHHHNFSYQEEYDGGHHSPSSFSSCSSSDVFLSPLTVSSGMMENRTYNCDWLSGNLSDESSLHGSIHSGKYSNLGYHFDDGHEISTTPKSTRFCPEENPYPSSHSKGPMTSKEKLVMDNSRLMRNRSLVDIRSQLLHRSLVEEITKRRSFKTASAVEDVGFQAPFQVSGKGFRQVGGSSRMLGPAGKRLSTVGAVEDIGFQAPFGIYNKGSRRIGGKRP
ncbi:probable serine/threonine-protein kinase WNK4 isoform X2 [Impatiens glandulifera]|uniref:probable serine/threonine-protein kinase WNK4 isoform X2 n=1 Tax=Impatiens glandulifera TaxID=253017 RepID=UPI001FB0B740|nr:probable serine/threonine-protein kinase WNK4 isoform X2 [Impatiens glandulifera]